VLVHHPPLLGAHLVELDRPVAAERLLGGAVGTALEHLAPALAVAGGVEEDPLALPHAEEGGLVAEQLQRVDRLPAAADQQAVVVVALDNRLDRLLVLGDLDVALEVELVEDALDHLAHALGGLLRPLLRLRHGGSLIRARPRAQRRFFFFLRGGGGGGFAARTSSGVGATGGGMTLLTTYCWPIVQTLVVIQ
jgi:hypothetical protein